VSAPRAAIITISTSKAAGSGDEDESGACLARFAEGIGAEVLARELIPDDRPKIEQRLRHWASDDDCALVLTTGGTGLAPSDLTPEATLAVIERGAPGIAEAMREASRAHTANWMLSRGVAGVRGATLIINFPGSPRSIEQAGAGIIDALPHALEVLAGRVRAH
jgi:molybdopterin adenylyltransferase